MVVVPMVPGKVVGVYIERDANATVPELLLDVFGIRPLLDEERGKGVAQVMKGDMPQVGPRETGLEPVSHELIAHPLVCGAEEDPGHQ